MSTETGPHGFRGHLRHYLRGLDHTGIVVGLLFFASSLTPSLLPRPWTLQGVISGVSFAGGYGLGVVLAAIARWAGVPRPSAGFRLRPRLVVFGESLGAYASNAAFDVVPQVHWYPLVTFWQVSGDLPFALDPPHWTPRLTAELGQQEYPH